MLSASYPSALGFSGPSRQPQACRSHGPRHPSRARLQASKYSSQFRDPYSILGLETDADEKQVKGAYRKLAKQYHPDVCKEPTEMQFLNISEAYEFLLQTFRSRRAGDAEGQKPGNSDAWHDWYWSFRMSRNWERQKNKVEDPAAVPQHTSTPQDAEGLRSQLAGLRHRAAIRRNRPTPEPVRSMAAGCDAVPAGEQFFVAAEGPSDSADPCVQQPPQPAAPLASAADTCASIQEPLASEAAQAEAEQATANEPPAQAPPRRKFVANTEVREGLKAQLHGMRRKAAIRQRFQHSSVV